MQDLPQVVGRFVESANGCSSIFTCWGLRNWEIHGSGKLVPKRRKRSLVHPTAAYELGSSRYYQNGGCAA